MASSLKVSFLVTHSRINHHLTTAYTYDLAGNYCINVRMRQARELLLTSSLKSYEIALQVGYENSIHFSRIFKQYHGMNPMEYKERFGGG